MGSQSWVELEECNLCKSKEIAPDKAPSIFRCKHCGYIFDNPIPANEEITRFYSNKNDAKWLIAFERDKRMLDAIWIRRLNMVKRLRSGGRLLDIGAGIGQFLFLAKNDFQVIGTEISESAIRVAKEKYALDLAKGQIYDINFKGDQFEVITIFHVLEHVPDPNSFMKKCICLLSKEGILIIAVPNDIESLKSRLARLVTGRHNLHPLTLDGTTSELHLSHFTRRTLKKWLIGLDLKIIEDTLDKIYFTGGKFSKVSSDLKYLVFLVISKVLDVNLYDTIWIAAKVNEAC